MSAHFVNRWRVTWAALGGIAMTMGLCAFRAQADEWDKKTILTVNQPIQVRDTVLQPGTYIFKLVDSASDRHIVQIFNSDQTQLIDTIIAIPDYRLQPKGTSRFLFWETPPGNARAMRAWFYPGDNYGQAFPYPKHLTALNTGAVTTTTATAQTEAPPQAERTAPEQPQLTQQQETTVTHEEVTQTPPPAPEQPTQMAQNTPPPAPAAPAPAETQPAPTTLPHTASPYPLIGLSGLFSLGLYGLLRLKRSA